MSGDKRDELEEFFQNGLEDFEVEIEADLLTPVQSRMRFDRYVRGIISALVLSSIIFSSIIYIYYPNYIGLEQVINQQSESEPINFSKIEAKNLTQKAMVMETVNFNFTPVSIRTFDRLPDNDTGTELTLATTGGNKEPTDQTVLPPITSQESAVAIKNSYTPAEPVKGFTHLYAYIKKELIYPDTLRVERIMGTVQVGFTINEKGIVKKVTIKSGVHHLLDQEAKRVIEHMPLWFPAKMGIKPVRSQMTIPITFDVEEIDVY